METSRVEGWRRRAPAVILAMLALLAAAAPAARAQDTEERWRRDFDRGLDELRDKRYDDSIRTFRGLVELRPERPEPYYNIACAHALLAERDEALAWLDKAIERGFRDEPHIDDDADLDPLRSEPGFHELMRRHFGRALPEPALRTLAGDEAPLARLRGKVVVVCFWRTDSEPARKAMPLLAALQDHNRQAGLFVVGVSDEPVEAQEAFADQHKVSFALLRQTGRLERPFRDVRAFPTIFVLDRDGLVRKRITGLPTRDELEAALEPLLTGVAPDGSDGPGDGPRKRASF